MPDIRSIDMLDAHDGVGSDAVSGRQGAAPETQYRAALVRYFMRHLSCREDAEDLAQEAFVRFAQQGSVQSIANVEAFMFRIASNLLRDRFRRNRTHRVRHHQSIQDYHRTPLGEAPSAECVYQSQERIKTFLKVLDAMPRRRRSVFLLQRYEGLTYSAIAQRLDISVSAVEKHMMKALLHFSAHMDMS